MLSVRLGRTLTSFVLLNFTEICCYSSEYATDVDVLVARKAVRAVGRIALRLPERANTCADKLMSLLSMEISYVTSEALIALASEIHYYDTCHLALWYRYAVHVVQNPL